jgi:protein-glutamine gamma-glutamyltransferase
MDQPSLRTVGERRITRGQTSFSAHASLSILLSVVVYAATAVAAAFPQAVLSVTIGVAVGSGVGALMGYRIARSRYRLVAITAVLVCGLFFFVAVHRILIGTVWLAETIGPSDAIRWADSLCYSGAALIGAAGLKTSTARFRSLSVLEVACVSFAFAGLLIAHRNGAINRPFEIADPIIAMGEDPTLAFLSFGVVTAFLIFAMLQREKSLLRSLLHFSMMAVILLLTLYATTAIGLPQPPNSSNQLGLRKNADQVKKEEKNGRENQRHDRQRSDHDLLFDDGTHPQSNRVPLAVVILHDDYSPPSGSYYFRQNAYSQYNGRRLVMATDATLDRDIIDFFPSDRITMPEVPNGQGERSTLDTTVALLADHERPFALEAPVALQPATNPDPGRFRRVYRVVSASLSSDLFSLLGRKAGDKKWNAQQFKHYIEGPNDPRYLELANKIIDKVNPKFRSDPLARALAISAWLSREGIYSRRSSHSKALDPTADFLFGDKTGYCVHFASAAAYLMRSIGLPTRVAHGYVVEESARRGGSTIVVTGEDSHAWPEVYLDGVGWIIVDAVPERSLDPPPQPPDPDLQRLLGEMVRGQRPLPYVSGRPFEPLLKLTGRMVRLIGWSVIYLSLAIVVILYGVKVFRRVIPVLGFSKSAPRLVYRADLDRLSEIYLQRRFGESREGFARRVEGIVPSFSELTRLHIRAAFGTGRDVAMADLRNVSSKIRQELRTAIPRWRRLVGILTPWSWLLSR